MRYIIAILMSICLTQIPLSAISIGTAIDLGKKIGGKYSSQFLDLARLVPLMEDMKAIDQEKARELNEIRHIVQDAATGVYFDDIVDSVYPWEYRRQVRNVESVFDILSRNGIGEDYFDKSKSALERYKDSVLAIEIGESDVSETTKDKIKKTRKEAETANALGKDGREKYNNKLNRDQVELLALIEDRLSKIDQNFHETNEIQRRQYDAEMVEKINYEDLFPSSNRVITAKKNTSWYEDLKRTLR